jgi:serine protease Do
MIRRIALALLVAGLIPAVSLADAKSKKAVGKLFVSALTKSNESTVRVRANGKDAALGTAVDAAGYILTKASELKGDLTVRFRDGTEYDAKYIGFDEKTDLALLKIDTPLVPAEFAPKEKIAIGNFVAAPGIDDEPVAIGVISVGIRRLVGAEAMIENTNKGYMGAFLEDPTDGQEGVIIAKFVDEGRSAAKEAKLKIGDLIVRVNDRSIKNREELMQMMNKFKPGETIELNVFRDENELKFKVKLLPKSASDRGEMQNRMGGPLSGRRTGFPSVIQHDMVLKPTDCGGPLVDLDGNILGINIARAGRVESWALPYDVIQPIVKEMKAGKLPPPKSE